MQCVLFPKLWEGILHVMTINLYSSIVSEIIYIYPKKIEISFCFKVSNIIREFKVDSMYYIIIIVGLNDWKRSKDKHTWKWIKCAVWKLHDRTKWQETMRTKLVMDCIESHSCVLKIQFFSQQQWNFDLKKKEEKNKLFHLEFYRPLFSYSMQTFECKLSATTMIFYQKLILILIPK